MASKLLALAQSLRGPLSSSQLMHSVSFEVRQSDGALLRLARESYHLDVEPSVLTLAMYACRLPMPVVS